MSHRQRLASLLHQTGVVRAALALRSSMTAPWLTILTYHRFPDPSGVELFDEEIADVTLEAFERQLACLRPHFTFIGVEELCAFARGEGLPPNAVAITFDDGYLDNYSRAFPILKRYGAKATFFLSTAYVDERRVYWWDRASYIVKRSSVPKIVLTYPFHMEVPLTNRRQAIDRVLRVVKTHPALDLERFLEELARAAGVAWSRPLEQSFADRLLMTWDHVRELKAGGMDVESHTRTHRVLQTLSPAELDSELAGSRADIERELGYAPRAVAYPVGNPLPQLSPIRAALERAGYEIGLTNCTGSNPSQGRVDRYNLKRQCLGLSLSEDYLLAMLTMPALAPRQWWDTAQP
jgi:peptidoglycan/xylan/chitin deacetylase (PgdA/CDA1 family)